MRKLFFKLTTAACLTLLMAACSHSIDEPDNGRNNGVIDNIELTPSELVANDGINEFGFKLLNELAKDKSISGKDNGNIAISPLSASLCLSMLVNSADAQIEDAISRMLGEPDINSLNSTCNKLMRFLPSRTNGGKLVLANSLWYNIERTPLKSWERNLEKVFFAETNGIDFADRASVDLINAWSAHYTEGLINRVVNQLDPETTICLLNAMYFIGKWDSPFKREETSQEMFRGRDRETRVDMMHADKTIPYCAADNFEMVCIPFDGSTDMLLLLPKEGSDVAELAGTLSYADFRSALDNLRRYNVEIALPKFKVGTSLNITGYLAQLGLPVECVLEKMGAAQKESLKVEQFTATSIDEEGAELAAVTVTGMDSAAGPSPAVAKVDFTHPFMYLVQNTRTRSILLAGIINNL